MVACHAIKFKLPISWCPGYYSMDFQIISSKLSSFSRWTVKHCFLRASYNSNSFYRSPLVVQFESTKFEPNYQPIKIVRYSNMIGEINLDSFVRKPYCDWLKSISRLGCIYCIVTLFLMNKTRPFASCCLYLPATSPEEL